MQLDWQWVTFKEISGVLMHEVLSIRQKVFLLEQKSLYQDIDDEDKQSWHLIVSDGSSIVAYARIVYSKLDSGELSIGRILVSPPNRNQGIGKVLVQSCVNKCKLEDESADVKISAQTYLIDFYQNFGFAVVSDVYDDSGVEHVDMLLR